MAQTKRPPGPARMTLVKTVLAPVIVELAVSGSWLCRLLAHRLNGEIAPPPRWGRRRDLLTRVKIREQGKW